MAQPVTVSNKPVTTGNPGYKTTEFLGSMAVVIALVVLAIADKITGGQALDGISVVTAGYAVSRGIAKN